MANTDRIRRVTARSKGREVAVQIAYAWEQNGFQTDCQLTTDDVDADPEVLEFANGLFKGVVAERLVVDKAIGARLANWSIGRLAVVDRALLRLGTYEIMCSQETPPKVVINEYIELAKLYGSEVKTARLVNGVLDRIAREHRSDEITCSFEKPVPMPTPSGGVPVLPE